MIEYTFNFFGRIFVTVFFVEVFILLDMLAMQRV